MGGRQGVRPFRALLGDRAREGRENLSTAFDRALQPLITPEYRWHLVFAAAYGSDPPARFTTLARSLDVDSAIHPVGRGKAVIIGDPRTGSPASSAER